MFLLLNDMGQKSRFRKGNLPLTEQCVLLPEKKEVSGRVYKHYFTTSIGQDEFMITLSVVLPRIALLTPLQP